MKLIEAAQRGELVLIMCEALYTEMQEVLERDKFRRWITLDECADFLATRMCRHMRPAMLWNSLPIGTSGERRT